MLIRGVLNHYRERDQYGEQYEWSYLSLHGNLNLGQTFEAAR